MKRSAPRDLRGARQTSDLKTEGERGEGGAEEGRGGRSARLGHLHHGEPRSLKLTKVVLIRRRYTLPEEDVEIGEKRFESA